MMTIWEDAPIAVQLTDEDFEAEFGRPRTGEERAAHEIFSDAAMLSEDGTWLAAGTGDDDGGEAL